MVANRSSFGDDRDKLSEAGRSAWLVEEIRR